MSGERHTHSLEIQKQTDLSNFDSVMLLATKKTTGFINNCPLYAQEVRTSLYCSLLAMDLNAELLEWTNVVLLR